MIDLITLAIGAAVFLVLCGGYALLQSYRAAGARVARAEVQHGTRRMMDGGSYVGGHDRPGSN